MPASRAPPSVTAGTLLGQECPHAPRQWGPGLAPAHIFPWVEGANPSLWAFLTGPLRVVSVM